MRRVPDETTVFRSPVSPAVGGPSGGATTALGFLLLPAIVILVVGVFVRGLDTTSVVVVLAVLIAIGAAIVMVRWTSAFVICSVGAVVVGLAPVWRTRLRTQNVSAVDLIEVDAFTEYGGWGIKGSAREERGRLYSAGGRYAVRLRTVDGRTFVVAFLARCEAERARRAVADLLACA